MRVRSARGGSRSTVEKWVRATMEITVLRVTGTTWIVIVACNVTPEGGTARLANADEVEVNLWGGGTISYNHSTLEVLMVYGPWGKIPDQPRLTNDGGQVIMGDPDTGGAVLSLPDGTYRISAVHRESGATVNRYFIIQGQALSVMTLQEVEAVGDILPEFKQALLGQPSALLSQPRLSSIEWPEKSIDLRW